MGPNESGDVMTVIRRFLDAFVNWKGDRLIIDTKDRATIVKEGKRIPIVREVLTGPEFRMLLMEFQKEFGDGERIEFKGESMRVEIQGNRMEMIRDGAGDLEIPGLDPAGETGGTIMAPIIDASPASEEGGATRMAVPPDPAADSGVTRKSPATDGLTVSLPQEGAVSSRDGNLTMRREPVPATVVDLLAELVNLGASDLHVSNQSIPMARVQGRLVPLSQYRPFSSGEVSSQLMELMPESRRLELKDTGDSCFSFEIKGSGRFRAGVFRDNLGISAVFRSIPNELPDAAELGLPGSILDLCGVARGLVLVTGLPGSGKSTTMAALVDHINRHQRRHVITIEDPLEFIHTGRMSMMSQREVHTHTESFSRALNAAAREDPDVLVLGEIREPETIVMVMEMARGRCLVLGTMNASSAREAVEDLIISFPREKWDRIRALLSLALTGVVYQTLEKNENRILEAVFDPFPVTPDVAEWIRNPNSTILKMQ